MLLAQQVNTDRSNLSNRTASYLRVGALYCVGSHQVIGVKHMCHQGLVVRQNLCIQVCDGHGKSQTICPHKVFQAHTAITSTAKIDPAQLLRRTTSRARTDAYMGSPTKLLMSMRTAGSGDKKIFFVMMPPCVGSRQRAGTLDVSVKAARFHCAPVKVTFSMPDMTPKDEGNRVLVAMPMTIKKNINDEKKEPNPIKLCKRVYV